jgi:hypothetical protein
MWIGLDKGMGYSLSSKEISGREILLCRVLTPCLIQRRFGLATCCFGMKNLDVETGLEPLINEFKSIWINLNPPNHPISPCFWSAASTIPVRQRAVREVIRAGLSLDPHILCVGACTLVLTGVSLVGCILKGTYPCRGKRLRVLEYHVYPLYQCLLFLCRLNQGCTGLRQKCSWHKEGKAALGSWIDSQDYSWLWIKHL